MRFPKYSNTIKKWKCSDFLQFFTTNSLSWSQLSYINKSNLLNIHYGLIHTGAPTLINCDKYQLPYIQSEIKNFTLCKNGDIIFTDASEDTNDICKPVELVNVSNYKVVSGLHTIHARDIKNLTTLGFKGYLFSSYNFHKQVYRLTQGTKIFSININNFKELYVGIPSFEEQQDIVSLLSKIDARIDTQSKIIEDLETFKLLIMDGVLKKNLFIELSIKELTKFNYARLIKPSEMKEFTGEKYYLSTSSIDKNGITGIESNITYLNRPSRASMIPLKNSVWFAKMKNTTKVYKSENDDETKYVLSTGFYGLLCNENKVNSDWMVEIFKSNYFSNQKNKFSEGSSMSGIKDNQLEDIKIKIFKNKQLESNYCVLFRILNKKIKNESNLLKKYKEQKKYLLSNMFI